MQRQESKTWSRDTSWRQGSVLPEAAAQHFGLSNAVDAAATCVVVISHDCDLANSNLDAEPEVEVLVGRLVPNENGNFTWGKAPRTLHYAVTRDGVPAFIELVNTSKRPILKSALVKFDRDPSYSLDGKALAVLRSWLGSRYNRAAFPDSFVNRMKELKVDTKLAKALEKQGELVSFVYFDVDSGKNVERGKDDPYQLSVILVFAPGRDAGISAEAADELAGKVERDIQTRLQGHSTEIVLKSCFAISEDDLTVSRARLLTQWRLEYMTLKADDEQPSPLA